MGGHIAGKGSTCYFTLPIQEPAVMFAGQETALRRVRYENRSLVEESVKAMAFLRREGTYADAPRPDLILRGLNLPKKDGSEDFVEIKSDIELKRIPLEIVATSHADEI